MKFLALLFLVPASLAMPSSVEERIVGGSNAPVGRFPYQVSLRRSNDRKHFCGGSIISETVILTAAHCFRGLRPSDVLAVVGTNKLNSGGTAYGISRIVSHLSYNPQNNNNDIAILITNDNIQYNNRVQPIELASSNPEAGATTVLTGWGLTSYRGNNIPNDLQQITTLRTLSLEDCSTRLPGFPITTGHVCTIAPFGQGACQGDSGGPLVSNGVQIGIVSWGIPCATGNPDIFTNVAFYGSWIRQSANV